jgi:outer membrane protein assembly factor BamB
VVWCEVCGKPICQACVGRYEGIAVCSEPCWNQKMSAEQTRAAAEGRHRRRSREEKANRTVVVGLWAVLVAVIAGVALFAYGKMSDHSGEKLWEESYSSSFHNFSVSPQSDTAWLALGDGTIQAIDTRSRNRKWGVKLPENLRALRPKMMDEGRCLIRSENALYMCSSIQTAPLWDYTTPQPSLSAEPVIVDDSIYIASSSRYSHFGSFDEEDSVEAMLRGLWPPPADEKEESEEPENVSTISSVNINSGAEQWRTALEGFTTSGLIADGNVVYAAGYGPDRDREEPSVDATITEDDTAYAYDTVGFGTTELWALDAATGNRIWQLECTGNFLFPPMLSRDGIVLATQRNIYLISPSGEQTWTFPLRQRIVRALRPHDDRLLFSTADGFLVSLDLLTGDMTWITEIGADAEKIIVSPPLACVAGMTAVNQEPRKVLPTKRWEGSEDLLQKAIKRPDVVYQPVLLGIDLETGETRWSIPRIDGDFDYSYGIVYALRYYNRVQLLDASADPSEFAKTITNLGAYNFLTGEKLWETAIDGYASDLRLAQTVALVKATPAVLSFARGGGEVAVRLVGVSLE